MAETNIKFITQQNQFEKKEPGFLFGNYELIERTPYVLEDVFKCFQAGLKIVKCIKKKASYFPNPHKIGLLQMGNNQTSDLYYMPQSINNLYHGSYEGNAHGHLLLIEHPEDEKFLFITVVENSAHSPYWGLYTKAWELGLFNDRINELKSKLIYIGE